MLRLVRDLVVLMGRRLGSDSENTRVSIGRYRILGELGRGGMGVVLLGQDPDLEREVAIKVLPPHLSGDPLAYARFQREARLLATLNHPNIATIHSLETADSTPILTMERIRGVTLAAKLAAGGLLPVHEAVAIGVSIARALEAAHDRGVIHRDLKPGNVMIREDGEVKVLDFGLATEVVSAHPNLPRPVDARDGNATLPAHALAGAGLDATRRSADPELGALELTSASDDSRGSGTPGYMSPEQILNQPLDERSDVFSFGCVLYECFSGVPFAAGDSAWERLQSTLHPNRSVDALPAELPASIRAMIGKCLTKDVAERLPKIRLARQTLEETVEQWTVERRARETGILAESAAARRTGAGGAGDPCGNLPRLLTSFVGRKREIEALTTLLDAHRLVTLTGPGGSGKTRLSLEAARGRAAEFPDGIWFAELGSVTDPRLVDKTVMTTLGIEEKSDRPARDAVVEHFEGRTALLVLDNCEHLVAACADLAHAILRHSANTKVLATSRETLGVPGESRFVVPPLEALDPESSVSLDAARANEAVALFADRAQQVRRDFTITEGNLEAVLGICRRLDGLPLALELAASRVRALSPADILLRLNDRFRLLSAGGREQLPHHRTLWASIDWSHEQLDETERALFRRLSLFVGGWSLNAAEFVCAGSGIEDWEILDALTRLIDKSLVEIDFARESSSPRYRMLETIREYASAKLKESGEVAQLQKRFLEHFESFSRQGALGMVGPEAPEWLAKTDLDYGNLREAIRLSLVEDDDLLAGLSTVASLVRYWMKRSHWSEGRSFLTQVLSHPKAPEHALPHARALNSAGALAYTAGDYTAATSYLMESSRLFEELGDRPSLGRALMNLGNAQSFAARFEAGLEFQERALTIAREDDDKWLIAACLTNICNSAEALGNLERVEEASKEAAALFQAIGDQAGFLMAQNYLAVVSFRRGRHEEAIAYYESSLQIANELGDRYQAAMMRLHRGLAFLCLGRLHEARVDYVAALKTAQEFNEPMLSVTTIDAFAGLAEQEGDFERSLRLVGFIEEHRKRTAMPRREFDDPPFQATRRALREGLGDRASDELEAQGRTFSLEDAIAYAVTNVLPG